MIRKRKLRRVAMARKVTPQSIIASDWPPIWNRWSSSRGLSATAELLVLLTTFVTERCYCRHARHCERRLYLKIKLVRRLIEIYLLKPCSYVCVMILLLRAIFALERYKVCCSAFDFHHSFSDLCQRKFSPDVSMRIGGKAAFLYRLPGVWHLPAW